MSMVAHAFNPNTQTETGRSLEFEASLVYRASCRTARSTQGNPVSEGKKEREGGREKRSLASQASFKLPRKWRMLLT